MNAKATKNTTKNLNARLYAAATKAGKLDDLFLIQAEIYECGGSFHLAVEREVLADCDDGDKHDRFYAAQARTEAWLQAATR